MDKFAIDYNQLENSLEISEQRVMRYDDVKHRLEKVAYNIVRFRDNSDLEELWQVKETPDGPVIVALYNTNEENTKDGDWSAVPDIKTASVHVYYKGDPIVRIAARDLNIPDSEVALVARWLPSKLASDHQTRSFVLSYIGPQGIEEIKNSYPELRKSAFASRKVPIDIFKAKKIENIASKIVSNAE